MSDQVERKPRNEFNEALPQIFNREGVVKKNPSGTRATGRDFVRIMAKVQKIRSGVMDSELNVSIVMSVGSITLNDHWSVKLCVVSDDEFQPDLIAALLLNGWIVSAE